jgi:hypothetical protein
MSFGKARPGLFVNFGHFHAPGSITLPETIKKKYFTRNYYTLKAALPKANLPSRVQNPKSGIVGRKRVT